MTWDAVHNRGAVLRTVVAEADRRRDGVLPTDVAGVGDTFSDELDLLAALQLRWHTRLAGRIERALAEQDDLPTAVVTAWRRTAEEMPGVRAVLDAYGERPTDDPVGAALAKARAKDRVLMAAMAGLASGADSRSVAVGHRLERQAREGLAVPSPRPLPPTPQPHRPASRLRQLLSHLAA